jgi:hypothetical protein
VLNKILLILLIATIAATGVVAWTGSRDLRDAKAAVAEYEGQLVEIREKLADTNMKYRGISGSLSTVPDSLKKSVTGEYMRTQAKYRKQLIGYESEEREALRMKRKRERRLAEVQKQVNLRLLLTGGTAVVLAGALIVRRSIRS